MFLRKSLLVLILLLPVLEIAAFVLVAAQVGVLSAFGLLLLASVAGVLLLRHAGRAQMTRVRAALAQGAQQLDIGDLGLFTLLAGVLLLIPGFLTDILAVLLLIPPARRAIGAAFGRLVTPRPPTGGPVVVDLDQQEWHRIREPELPAPDQPEPPDRGPSHKGYRERP